MKSPRHVKKRFHFLQAERLWGQSSGAAGPLVASARARQKSGPVRAAFGAMRGLAALLPLFGALAPGMGRAADDALIAVAANFVRPMERLAADFRKRDQGTLKFTTGATGKLYAQIRNGAPFDAFLAADQRRPLLLEEQGLALAGSRFTYALGRLALWSADPARELNAQALRAGGFRKLAIANPDLAPYGRAAWEALRRLGLREALQDRIVRAENVGQAFAFAATGNAELALIAAAQARRPALGPGRAWLLPAHLHGPIRQDAVLLSRAGGKRAAAAFLGYLKSPAAKAIILAAGYDLAEEDGAGRAAPAIPPPPEPAKETGRPAPT